MATPLGNPGDLSVRARELLGSVDAVLAEDTRRAGFLLARCGIVARSLSSFHEHNEQARIPQTLAMLQEGRQLALISDAGTPLFSDPGYRLVKACREADIRVSPLPGPCAPVAALSASGLPPYPFAFLGFAPRKESEREAFFLPYASLGVTLAFFERKDRLSLTLQTAYRLLGPRQACIARELTKTHEEFIPFFLEKYEELPSELLGEITVLVGPPLGGARTKNEELDRIIEEEAARGGKPRELARRVRMRAGGWGGKELYHRLRGARAREGTDKE